MALLPSSRACYKLARPLTTHWLALAFSHSIDLSHQQTNNSSTPLHQEEPGELLRLRTHQLNNHNHHHHVSALLVTPLPAPVCVTLPFPALWHYTVLGPYWIPSSHCHLQVDASHVPDLRVGCHALLDGLAIAMRGGAVASCLMSCPQMQGLRLLRWDGSRCQLEMSSDWAPITTTTSSSPTAR